jgi:hypothetical protein
VLIGLWHGPENATQIAENSCNYDANGDKARKKWFAGICPNLLIPFD